MPRWAWIIITAILVWAIVSPLFALWAGPMLKRRARVSTPTSRRLTLRK